MLFGSPHLGRAVSPPDPAPDPGSPDERGDDVGEPSDGPLAWLVTPLPAGDDDLGPALAGLPGAAHGDRDALRDHLPRVRPLERAITADVHRQPLARAPVVALVHRLRLHVLLRAADQPAGRQPADAHAGRG